jgi:hypothetical protein
LWNHANNSDLKTRRKDPNVLSPGDVVFIPDLAVKELDKAAEAKYRFKLKGVPAKLHLKLTKPKKEEPKTVDSSGTDESKYVDPGPEKPIEYESRSNVPFALEVDGVIVKQGSSDGDGKIEVPIYPNAKAGRLILNPGTPEKEVIALDLGGMDPIDQISGVRKRLANLGYGCVPDGAELTADLQAALRDFQDKNGLNVSGKPDQPTQDKLKTVHGC